MNRRAAPATPAAAPATPTGNATKPAEPAANVKISTIFINTFKDYIFAEKKNVDQCIPPAWLKDDEIFEQFLDPLISFHNFINKNFVRFFKPSANYECHYLDEKREVMMKRFMPKKKVVKTPKNATTPSAVPAKKEDKKPAAPAATKKPSFLGAIVSAASSVVSKVFGLGGKKGEGKGKGSKAGKAAIQQIVKNPPEPSTKLESKLDDTNEMFSKFIALFQEFRKEIKLLVKSDFMKTIVTFLNCLRLKNAGDLLQATIMGFTKNYELVRRTSIAADITIISEMLCHWQVVNLFNSHMLRAKKDTGVAEKWDSYSKAIAKFIRALQH